MDSIDVHTQSDQFRCGWAAGFYDALSHEGLRLIDEVLRSACPSDASQDFVAGYKYGLRVRVDGAAKTRTQLYGSQSQAA